MTRRADTRVMKPAALVFALACLATPPAVADDDACPENQAVSVNRLVTPVVTDAGALAGYAFVTPRVCLSRSYSALDFREREHFLMDALVRGVQHSPFRLQPDGAFDRTDAEAAFRRALAQVYDPDRVSAIALAGDDARLMRP